ncbi:hypothetical protein GGP91_003347 [Salinibacter ruber]|nr:hypothetical protein [Salinibacter ruber]MCS3831246.1 hypothetical protein [Salinibacter ruber]
MRNHSQQLDTLGLYASLLLGFPSGRLGKRLAFLRTASGQKPSWPVRMLDQKDFIVVYE